MNSNRVKADELPIQIGTYLTDMGQLYEEDLNYDYNYFKIVQLQLCQLEIWPITILMSAFVVQLQLQLPFLLTI